MGRRDEVLDFWATALLTMSALLLIGYGVIDTLTDVLEGNTFEVVVDTVFWAVLTFFIALFLRGATEERGD